MGRGNYATPNEQTGENSPQTANSTAEQPLLLDGRRKQHYYEAQTKLLELVDEYMFEETVSGPIEQINDLLYHWLTNPGIDGTLPNIAGEAVRNRLYQAFQLVNFLAKAYEINISLQNAKEVSRED